MTFCPVTRSVDEPETFAGYIITDHAVERYRERAQVRKVRTARQVRRIMADKLAGAILIQKQRNNISLIYGRGWVFPVKGNIVITAMKPRQYWMMELIRKAHLK